ncbi:3-hydroxybutyryl-CoA dehydrogenase [Massilia niabensis]|uniref:3-hydroxybutyryl-CoA dehydrogenase n=1 Tax=Massilia niabensis TaxID=544910 RepID=A0ABW0LF86_9BURK
MEFNTIGIIGAGIMGSGIVQVCAAAGHEVVLVDVTDAAVRKGIAAIGSSLDRAVSKGKLSAVDAASTLERIRGTTDYASLSRCGLVIEAATENPEIKRRILEQVDAIVGPDAIIATNTSSLSITKLAAEISRPDRFIGMHFFNPVPAMALVEVIRGLQTSDITHERVKALAIRLGKTSVAVKNSPGFAVNRILCPMLNEAIFVLQEGLTSAEEIDAGMKLGCNHPIGPLALADMIGLDTLLSVLETFYEGFSDPKYRPAPLLKEMVDAGRLGRKTGRGFYEYTET